jgi:hypothetical protein
MSLTDNEPPWAALGVNYFAIDPTPTGPALVWVKRAAAQVRVAATSAAGDGR